MPKLIQFILEQAELQPIARRIELYRELAELLKGNSDFATTREKLLGLAESLEAIARQSAQILFEFSNLT